jgi:NAD(P)-dependent dehydrogenase (short-subunit alcohol dehydrogenase family)
VIVTDLEDARGQAVVAEIGSSGGEAVYLRQGVSLEESWPAVIEATERRFGRLDGNGRERRDRDHVQG